MRLASGRQRSGWRSSSASSAAARRRCGSKPPPGRAGGGSSFQRRVWCPAGKRAKSCRNSAPRRPPHAYALWPRAARPRRGSSSRAGLVAHWYAKFQRRRSDTRSAKYRKSVLKLRTPAAGAPPPGPSSGPAAQKSRKPRSVAAPRARHTALSVAGGYHALHTALAHRSECASRKRSTHANTSDGSSETAGGAAGLEGAAPGPSPAPAPPASASAGGSGPGGSDSVYSTDCSTGT